MTWIPPIGLLLALAGPATSLSPVRDDPCAPEKPAYGSSFVVPLEVAQGVTLGRGSPAPYAASIRLYPSYVLDRRRQVRIALASGVALVNPKLEALVGGRLSTSIFELKLGPIRGIGLHLGLEGLYGTSDRGLLGLMLIGDIGGAAQGTIRAEQDLTHGATLLELGLGFHVYDGSTPEKAPVLPTPPHDYLGLVAQGMARDFKAAIGTVRKQSVPACQKLVAAAGAFVRQPSPDVTTVEAFHHALTDAGLEQVETLMFDPEPAPAGVTELQVVRALYRGMADVLGIPPGP
jgi:hypothetical protein